MKTQRVRLIQLKSMNPLASGGPVGPAPVVCASASAPTRPLASYLNAMLVLGVLVSLAGPQRATAQSRTNDAFVAGSDNQASAAVANPSAGAWSIIVHPMFGGLIFGFDIDPKGGEGLLSEAVPQSDGSVIAAVETFDPETGEILKLVSKTASRDDFVTLGIVGNSVGLVEREHVISLFNVKRTFAVLNPLSLNKFTAAWTPPIGQGHVINEVRRAEGSDSVAVYAVDVSLQNKPLVFRSNVAANTFGPMIPVTDIDFDFENAPQMAFDNVKNQAVLGHATNSQFIVPPKIGLVDLSTGAFSKFTGKGLGVINGIAVDAADGIACTTTSFDASVQFYRLSEKKAFATHNLPNAGINSLFAGQHIEYDPVNGLFLVAQPFSSTGAGSSIQVYDKKGNFVESVNGLSFFGETNVFPVHMALNPAQRTGFVDGPDLDVTDIQSFSY
jgi:hypothetical protein